MSPLRSTGFVPCVFSGRLLRCVGGGVGWPTRRGQIAAAHEQIVPILPHLPTVAAVGWDEPLRAYVVCTRILQAAHNPSAAQLLDQGLSLLERLAANITDHNHRQHFLNALPAHRQLRSLRLR